VIHSVQGEESLEGKRHLSFMGLAALPGNWIWVWNLIAKFRQVVFNDHCHASLMSELGISGLTKRFST